MASSHQLKEREPFKLILATRRGAALRREHPNSFLGFGDDMAARGHGGGDVSLAQVEEELRAAEAYLHQYDTASAPTASGGDGSSGRAAVDGMVTPLPEEASTALRQRSPDETSTHIRTPVDSKTIAALCLS